jgi:hypothetical protein
MKHRNTATVVIPIGEPGRFPHLGAGRIELHRHLRHDPRGTSQHRRIGQHRSWARRDLKPVLDVPRLTHHRMADTWCLALHQSVFLDGLR